MTDTPQHETLRLYSAVVHLSRHLTEPETVVVRDKTHVLPAPCTVYVNITSVAMLPEFWGDDSLEFRPTRWIAPPAADGSVVGNGLITPEKGSFLAWSSGPRMCPGQKMSQVEFTAVIAGLFHRHSAETVVYDGETPDLARERLRGVLLDSSPRLTMQMNRPRDVHLRWTKR